MMRGFSTDELIKIYHVDTDWRTPFRTDVTPTDVVKALRFSTLTGIKENARYALATGTIAMLSGLTGAVNAIEAFVFRQPEPFLLVGAAAFGLATFTGYIALGNAHATDRQYRNEVSSTQSALS